MHCQGKKEKITQKWPKELSVQGLLTRELMDVNETMGIIENYLNENAQHSQETAVTKNTNAVLSW